MATISPKNMTQTISLIRTAIAPTKPVTPPRMYANMKIPTISATTIPIMTFALVSKNYHLIYQKYHAEQDYPKYNPYDTPMIIIINTSSVQLIGYMGHDLLEKTYYQAEDY